MDLRQLVTAIRKGWWLIAICMLLGLGAAFVYNVRATPQYASTVTFFVSTPTGDGTSPLAADQFATRRITSYVGLLSSDVVADRIVQDTGLEIDPAEVASSIEGQADLNTVLLTATVTQSSPELSLQIAEGIAEDFGAIVNEVDPIGPGQVELRVISGPTLNPAPVAPRTNLNLALGLAGGAALGVIVVLLRSRLDTSVRQIRTLSILTDDAPVLGVIPFDRDARKSPIMVDGRSRSIQAEALRQVRTSLQFVDVESRVQVVVITSSISGEGKSTAATNLAISFRQSGRKVLLIDADLRRPRVSAYLGLEGSVGLTNVLAEQVTLDDVVQPWGGGGMMVLPSGSIPPNPSELLGSERMAELLATLRKNYDIIVIDTPPLLPVTDAAVLATQADGAALVARYGKVSRNQVGRAVRSLRAVDGRLLGTILNGAPRRGHDGYESYGYGAYNEHKDAPSLDESEAIQAVTPSARGGAGPLGRGTEPRLPPPN
ncbi:MAG TPA: polysaccharide biosynthesis tyrosine autokinase [Nakamurella sp.]